MKMKLLNIRPFLLLAFHFWKALLERVQSKVILTNVQINRLHYLVFSLSANF
jgi:hypothetical protein